MTDELEQTIAPVCASAGLDLVDVELRGNHLQVTVDRDGGLDLDAVAEAARLISAVLDAHEELVPGEPFELEVSSPGVERRLRRPEHFARVVGSPIAVRTKPGTDGERRTEGDLLAADEDGVVLAEDGGSRRIAYEDIERAHTVFDWRAALKSGSGPDQKTAREAEGAREASNGPPPAGSAGVGPAATRRGGQKTKERQSQ